jgi:hypothetical protein
MHGRLLSARWLLGSSAEVHFCQWLLLGESFKLASKQTNYTARSVARFAADAFGANDQSLAFP